MIFTSTPLLSPNPLVSGSALDACNSIGCIVCSIETKHLHISLIDWLDRVLRCICNSAMQRRIKESEVRKNLKSIIKV